MNNFKVALALTTSLMFFNVHAESCLGEICAGEAVISEDNTVYRVISVNPETREVTAKANSGYNYTLSVAGLSDEIVSSVLPRGKRIVNPESETGIVEMTFRNGVTVYKKSSGYTYADRNVSPEVESLGDVKRGAQILNSDDERGVVTYVFANNSVFYKKNSGYEYSSKLNAIAYQVSESGLFSTGARTINADDERGIVTAAFSDGRISYKKSSGYEYVGHTRTLSAAVASSGEFRMGATLLNSDDETVTATDVFADGRVMYKKSSGYEYAAHSSKLSYAVASLEGEIFRAGGRVLDNDDNEGVIKNTFADGRISYAKSSGYVYVSRNLSPESSEHPKYSKDKKYANDSVIAKPSRFYANGKISFQGYVTSSLAEATEEFNGLRVGDEVVTLDNKSAKIEELYENGMVSASMDKKSFATKLRTAKELERKGTLLDLVQQLEYSLLMTEDRKILMSAADAAQIKPLVIEALSKDKGVIMSIPKVNREKMLKILGAEVSGPTETEVAAQTPAIDMNAIVLDVEPATLIKQASDYLTSIRQSFVLGSAQNADRAQDTIMIRHSKSGLGGKCDVIVKRGMITLTVSKSGMGNKDPKKCVNEIKAMIF